MGSSGPGNGTMASIAKRPNGKWRARYRDQAGKEHAAHFTRKIDAQRWLDENTASIVSGRWVDPKAGQVTFSAYFEGWVKRQVWVQASVESSRRAVESTPFKDEPMRAILHSDVEGWVKAMSATKAPSTIKKNVTHVRQVFRAAVRDKVIAEDPAEGVVLPRQRRRGSGVEIPTPDEVRRLLAAADPAFRPFVALCAFAGLRKAEASAVKVEDVDFLRRTLHVRRQLQRETGKGLVERAPKYGSERDVYLPDDLVVMLSRHLEDPGVHPDGWLFIGPSGGPLDDGASNHQWGRVRAAAGLPDVNLHSLRHFYASGLIAAGCDVVTVQRALGHASASTTLNTYSHLWPSAEDRTRKAAAGMMASALADSVRTEGRKQASD